MRIKNVSKRFSKIFLSFALVGSVIVPTLEVKAVSEVFESHELVLNQTDGKFYNDYHPGRKEWSGLVEDIDSDHLWVEDPDNDGFYDTVYIDNLNLDVTALTSYSGLTFINHDGAKPATLVVSGDNYISAAKGATNASGNGILSYIDLTIVGDGTLTIEAENNAFGMVNSQSLLVIGEEDGTAPDITVTSNGQYYGAKLYDTTIYGGTFTVDAPNAVGINADGIITMYNDAQIITSGNTAGLMNIDGQAHALTLYNNSKIIAEGGNYAFQLKQYKADHIKPILNGVPTDLTLSYFRDGSGSLSNYYTFVDQSSNRIKSLTLQGSMPLEVLGGKISGGELTSAEYLYNAEATITANDPENFIEWVFYLNGSTTPADINDIEFVEGDAESATITIKMTDSIVARTVDEIPNITNIVVDAEEGTISYSSNGSHTGPLLPLVSQSVYLNANGELVFEDFSFETTNANSDDGAIYIVDESASTDEFFIRLEGENKFDVTEGYIIYVNGVSELTILGDSEASLDANYNGNNFIKTKNISNFTYTVNLGKENEDSEFTIDLTGKEYYDNTAITANVLNIYKATLNIVHGRLPESKLNLSEGAVVRITCGSNGLSSKPITIDENSTIKLVNTDKETTPLQFWDADEGLDVDADVKNSSGDVLVLAESTILEGYENSAVEIDYFYGNGDGILSDDEYNLFVEDSDGYYAKIERKVIDGEEYVICYEEYTYYVYKTSDNSEEIYNVLWIGKVLDEEEEEEPTVIKPEITTQPTASVEVEEGSITGSLSVAATVSEGTLTYQWYKSSSADGSNATSVSGATSATLTIPTDLVAGTYYFYCEVTVNDQSVKSNVATVVVTAKQSTSTDKIVDLGNDSITLNSENKVQFNVTEDNNTIYLTGLLPLDSFSNDTINGLISSLTAGLNKSIVDTTELSLDDVTAIKQLLADGQIQLSFTEMYGSSLTYDEPITGKTLAYIYKFQKDNMNSKTFNSVEENPYVDEYTSMATETTYIYAIYGVHAEIIEADGGNDNTGGITLPSSKKDNYKEINTPEEVEDLYGKDNTITTVEVFESKKPVKVTIKLDKKYRNHKVYALHFNEETDSVELVATTSTNNKSYVSFETTTTGVIALTSSLPEGFIEVLIDGNTYYVKENSEFHKGWINIEDTWYFLDYVTGIRFENGWKAEYTDWYFLDADGKMLTNSWIARDASGSIWYYVNESGEFVRNQWVNGYYIDANGEWHA